MVGDTKNNMKLSDLSISPMQVVGVIEKLDKDGQWNNDVALSILRVIENNKKIIAATSLNVSSDKKITATIPVQDKQAKNSNIISDNNKIKPRVVVEAPEPPEGALLTEKDELIDDKKNQETLSDNINLESKDPKEDIPIFSVYKRDVVSYDLKRVLSCFPDEQDDVKIMLSEVAAARCMVEGDVPNNERLELDYWFIRSVLDNNEVKKEDVAVAKLVAGRILKTGKLPELAVIRKDIKAVLNSVKRASGYWYISAAQIARAVYVKTSFMPREEQLAEVHDLIKDAVSNSLFNSLHYSAVKMSVARYVINGKMPGRDQIKEDLRLIKSAMPNCMPEEYIAGAELAAATYVQMERMPLEEELQADVEVIKESSPGIMWQSYVIAAKMATSRYVDLAKLKPASFVKDLQKMASE
jgi:hypothetical protein